MHEYAIVESIVGGALKDLESRRVDRVSKVRFRRGSAFSEEALNQAFTAVTAGTIIENAIVEIETINMEHRCSCGREQIITSDDLMGHMFVCPQCGTIREVDEHGDLELLGVVVERYAAGSGVQSSCYYEYAMKAEPEPAHDHHHCGGCDHSH